MQFVIEGLAGFLDGMNRAQGSVKSLGGVLKAFENVSNIGKGIAAIGIAISGINPPAGLVITAVGLLTEALGAMGQVVGGVVGRAIDGLIGLIKNLARAIDSLVAPIFNFIGNVLNAINPLRMLADLIDRIAYISLGILTADVFRALSRGLVDVGKQALNAASQFQLLHLRLQGLIARDTIQGLTDAQLATANFKQILADSVKPANDLFVWIRKIAVTTPFTVVTLSNAFALAKAYNLDTETAKKLVTATGNFVAGMNLEDGTITRVIENMGQMIQQGKITGTELRDLARGAYVPTTEILQLMAKKAGVTTEAMRKLWSDGKASVQDFINAFILIANRDFPDAMERMTATFPGIINNVGDFIQAVMGFSVLGPAVDVLTSKFGKLFIDIVGDPRVLEEADKLGAVLKSIVETLYPADLTSDSVVDKIVGAIEHLMTILKDLRDGNYLKFLQDLGVPDWVIKSIGAVNIAFQNMKTFWDQNGDELISIVTRVLDTIGLKNFTPSKLGADALGGLMDITKWMVDHGPEIVQNVDSVGKSIEHFATVTLPLLFGNLNASEGGPNMTTLDKLAVTLNNLGDALGKIGDAWNSVAGPAIDSMAKSFSRLGLAADGLNPALTLLVNILSVFAGLSAGALSGIASTLDVISTSLQQLALSIYLVNQGIDDLKNGNIAEGLGEIWAGIIEGIMGFVGFLTWPLAEVLGFVNGTIGYFQHLSDALVGHSIIPDMMADMEAAFSSGFANVYTNIVSSVGEWLSYLQSQKAEFITTGDSIMAGFIKGMAAKLAEAPAKLQPGIDSLISWIGSIRLPGLTIGVNISRPGGGGSWNSTNPNVPHSGSPFAAKGYSGVIPPGFPNDSYTIHVTSGEYVNVLPKGLTDISVKNLPAMVGKMVIALDNLASAVSAQVMAQNSMLLATVAAGSVNTSYNVNVNANYAATQSPANVSHDIEAVLAKVSR